MNKELKNYFFDNKLLRYESNIYRFDNKLFDEFDKKSEKLGLRSKIEDLMTLKVVNNTESKAASHPQFRKKNSKSYSISPSSLNLLSIKCNSKNITNLNVVVLGIGGSYEGPKLLIEFFGQQVLGDKKVNFQFITGSDINEFINKTNSLDPKETIFIVSSKSFSTDETIESLKQAIKWSIDTSYFIAITSNADEPLKYGIERDDIVSLDDEVGGRYSIWSQIAEFTIDKDSFNDFLRGGNKADEDLQKTTNDEYLNFVKYLAYSDIWLNNSEGKNIRAILSYIWKLRSFPNYVQQLEMESLGNPANKNSEFKNTGQVIFGGYGPTAQHSYFQLLHQGTQEICADIILSKEDSKSLVYAQAITQAKLLSNGLEDLKKEETINGNVPVNLFILKKTDAFTLGYLIATWEHRTFIASAMLGINPFDQFGVNAGKIYTKKYLADKD